MADAKISQLPVATTLDGTELVAVVQSGTTDQTTVAAFTAAAAASSTVVSSSDIGTAPNEIPLNQYLGSLAYVDTAMVPAPATATSAGQQGQLAQDGSYLYVCTALNTWKRVAISTF